ncbi:MAG: Nramp family divalent metal transporter [Rhodothermales bacterium]|nr:Nramp family divalent metal transporter [Rhodothermales bacterium]
MRTPKPSGFAALIAVIAPGMLVAATGVGAGDLATATFSGSQLGLAVLWAVVVGGLFKFTLNEGLARWQLATGSTFIEGAVRHLGKAVGWVFLPYLLLWSLFVGTALMGACGVALYAIVPAFEQAATGKVVFGIAASALGFGLLRVSGYRGFERIMGVLIGLMVITVTGTALLLWPGADAFLSGLLIPSIPDAGGQGLIWTVGLMGGVGGTVTILCYGYWIRERGRFRTEDLRTCRLDLAAGYGVTVLFGLGMVVIGDSVVIDGGGADLLIRVADVLEPRLGLAGRWVFLVGALAAVFSSLLGVWQSVPYLFADVWYGLRGGAPSTDLMSTRAYSGYQLALATIPALGLFISFREAQLLYAVTGAAFMPLLALALLILNGRSSLVGNLRNRFLAIGGLLGTLAFFAWAAFQ